MSLSSVYGTLSNLKTCQQDIGTGMDLITDVAMDLVETGDENMAQQIKEMEAMILDCANVDREITCFWETVQQVTSEATPETMANLSERVTEQFAERKTHFLDADLQNHPKVVAFNQSIKSSESQGNQLEQSMVEVDEDLLVSQKSVSRVCPLTKVEMVDPVQNKKCHHCYDKEAILAFLSRQRSQSKKCRCPVVGCDNNNVKAADLIPYHPPRPVQRRSQQK